MFYSQHVLTRKGPLAKIWLAAHMQSKLTKAMVFATDLRQAIETILQPPAPMALRLTSNLLLGVARILHRKTKYLLQESADALTKLKLTFRPATSVDLPASSAPNFAAVTLADGSVDGLAAPMVDLSLIPRIKSGVGGSNSAFLAADRDITIDEFAGGLAGGMLDAFGMTADLELERENAWDVDGNNEPLLFTPSQRGATSRKASVKEAPAVDDNLGLDTVTPASVEIMREATDDDHNEDHAPVLSVGKNEGAEDKIRPSDELAVADDAQIASANTPGEKDGQLGVDVEMSKGGIDEGVTPPQLGTPLPTEKSSTAEARLSIGEPLSLGTPSASVAPNLDSGSAADDNDPMVEADSATAAAAIGAGNKASPVDNVLQVGSTPEVAKAAPEVDDATLDVGDATPDVADATRVSTASVGFQLMEDEEEAEAAEEEKAKAEMRKMAEGVEEPIDSQLPAKKGRKRKHALIEDPATEMSVEVFRARLTDTSDLVYGPNERRKGGERVRRAPLRLRDVLARPAVVMAPELSELFAASFTLEETGEVGSPMSDADLAKGKVGDENETAEKEKDRDLKKQEEDEEDGEDEGQLVPGISSLQEPGDVEPADQSAEKESAAEMAVTPLLSKSPVPDPLGLSFDALREDVENIATSQGAVVSPERPVLPGGDEEKTGEKLIDDENIGESQMAASHETARRLSFFTEDPAAAPQLDVGDGLDDEDLFDTEKISLRDVANTRSQVADENDGSSEQDVTETTVSARTRKMQEYIRDHVNFEGELDFSRGLEMEPNVSRRTAARTFYELLNLSSKKALMLQQDGAFGRITAQPVQPVFDSLATSKDR
eukprot:GFKZ01000491.1.p1 GENE.GFKZ01000491.1~~GFKZ01000491.1.p1  ORF type:complete len:833 (-),score=172.71 GFKZ01000491.1:606-3104(-)